MCGRQDTARGEGWIGGRERQRREAIRGSLCCRQLGKVVQRHRPAETWFSLFLREGFCSRRLIGSLAALAGGRLARTGHSLLALSPRRSNVPGLQLSCSTPFLMRFPSMERSSDQPRWVGRHLMQLRSPRSPFPPTSSFSLGQLCLSTLLLAALPYSPTVSCSAL